MALLFCRLKHCMPCDIWNCQRKQQRPGQCRFYCRSSRVKRTSTTKIFTLTHNDVYLKWDDVGLAPQVLYSNTTNTISTQALTCDLCVEYLLPRIHSVFKRSRISYYGTWQAFLRVVNNAKCFCWQWTFTCCIWLHFYCSALSSIVIIFNRVYVS